MNEVANKGRVLAVDPGQARIGIALSDELRITAQPLAVLKSRGLEEDATAIADLAKKHGAVELVVGLPLHMGGDERPGSEKARQLARLLEERTGLPVALWDERLSTVVAQQTLSAGGVSGRKQRGVVDKIAAAYILQGYLDRW